MRKLFLSMAAVAALLASCSKDDVAIDTPAAAGEQIVTFEVSSPELDTRYGEGEEATTLEWYVYEGNTPTYVSGLYGTKTFNKSTTVTIKFIQGRTYHVLFWAHEANAPYEVTANGTTAELTVDYDALTANQESYDAFYNFYDVGTVTAATQGGTVLLTRPFAQLNVGTSDTADANAANLNVTKTGIEVKTYEKMNFMTGEVDKNSAKTTTFTTAAKAEGTITANGHSYDHISMNYLLVNTKERVDVKLFLQEDNSQEVLERVYTSIPVERNHRTYILGTIYTQPADFTVVIDEKFTNDHLEEWDGTTYDEIEKGADGYYSVSHAAEFAYILQKETKEEVKIRLEADINFGGNEIPSWNTESVNGYKVTIEGNGNKIYNFRSTHVSTRTADDQIVGLFDVVCGAEVSNLTIEGAYVDAGKGGSAYAGVLFGKSYGTVELTNVTIKNSKLYGSNKIGAFVGYAADQTNLIIENCHVKDSYITTHDFTSNEGPESGLAGGFVGYISTGNNSISNSSIEGGEFNVINGTGKADRANGMFIGAVAGTAVVELTNCTAKDVTFNETSNGYTSPYGDFVGGNRGKATVIIDGAVYAIDADGDLTVDGATAVGSADSLVEALENGEDVYMYDDIKIDPAGMSNAYGTTGINVKNGQSINGNGNTLDIKGAGGTWDSGISTTGGLIENITVTGSFRGIFINHNSTHAEKVILKNVTTDGTTYTISCDQGTGNGLEATECTFKGWTSYAATLGTAKFVDCQFGEGSGYAFCRPYAPTEFVGCEFEAGFEIDARAKVTFENCTLGGEPLTADNLATLVTSNTANASVK